MGAYVLETQHPVGIYMNGLGLMRRLFRAPLGDKKTVLKSEGFEDRILSVPHTQGRHDKSFFWS
jgi:hypothetical protein